MKKELCFTDYIEIVTDTYDTLIYSPVFSSTLGLYLFNEDEKPIRDISLINHTFIVSYIDGRIRVMDSEILSVKISDVFFNRRMKMSIDGNLFKYDKAAAMYYDLDISKSIDYENKSRNRT